jgi:catechol 2,3-dioxygenase-like lactoylglutathione lyase family enzyme
MPTKMRHTGIVVTNLQESKKFYCDLLGFTVQKEMDEYGKFMDKLLGLENVMVTTSKMILENGSMLELLEYKSHPEPKEKIKISRLGCSHIALTVDDIDLLYSKLLRYGIEFNTRPLCSPDGKVKVVFCKDPDGNFIELVEEL